MSDYCRMKVLRVPCDKYGISDPWELEEQHFSLFSGNGVNRFKVAPTTRGFIDYILEDEYGVCDGDFGKTRALSDREKIKYELIFKSIIPDIDMNDVRLVEFCWYNCCEAPDYYDETNDPFYDEC